MNKLLNIRIIFLGIGLLFARSAVWAGQNLNPYSTQRSGTYQQSSYSTNELPQAGFEHVGSDYMNSNSPYRSLTATSIHEEVPVVRGRRFAVTENENGDDEEGFDVNPEDKEKSSEDYTSGDPNADVKPPVPVGDGIGVMLLLAALLLFRQWHQHRLHADA